MFGVEVGGSYSLVELTEGSEMLRSETRGEASELLLTMPVSVKKHSFCGSPGNAIQQQKLLSSP